MFQYPQTKIFPGGQNVSIPPYCILLITLQKMEFLIIPTICSLMLITAGFSSSPRDVL